MDITPFKLERFFSRYEFTATHLLCPSDCEPLSLQEVLDRMDGESRRLWKDLSLGYTETAGHPLLRRQVADLYDHVDAEQVLILAPEEGIFLTMHALLRKGDHVICTFPGYQSLYQIAQSLGCGVERWTARPGQDGTWHFDMRELNGMVREHTRLLVVNFPHNPTGALPEIDGFLGLAEWAGKRNITLFSDEMYRFLEYDKRTRLPAAVDLLEQAISLGGLSKSFSLPGLRIGWLVTRDARMRQAIQNLRDYTTICPPAPAEILGLAALRDRAWILKRNHDIVSRNRSLLAEFLGNHERLITMPRPLAGTLGFARWLGAGTADDLCRDLLEDRGVLLAPGSLFDVENRWFRIGFGRRDFNRALGEFDAYLESMA